MGGRRRNKNVSVPSITIHMSNLGFGFGSSSSSNILETSTPETTGSKTVYSHRFSDLPEFPGSSGHFEWSPSLCRYQHIICTPKRFIGCWYRSPPSAGKDRLGKRLKAKRLKDCTVITLGRLDVYSYCVHFVLYLFAQISGEGRSIVSEGNRKDAQNGTRNTKLELT